MGAVASGETDRGTVGYPAVSNSTTTTVAVPKEGALNTGIQGPTTPSMERTTQRKMYNYVYIFSQKTTVEMAENWQRVLDVIARDPDGVPPGSLMRPATPE